MSFQPDSFYLPPARVGFLAASITVDLVGTALIVALFIAALVWFVYYRRLAQLARESAAGDIELREGDAVIRGVVEADEDPSPAITIEIDQSGREWTYKGRWKHAWTETARRVSVRAFYVRRPTGERLRVEPNERVFLVDALDKTENKGPGVRTRLARLTPGEQVYAVGELTLGADPVSGGSGYRDAGRGLVLKPPGRGRMLISTEPLEQRHQKRARVHGIALLAIAAVGALFQLVLFRPFHMSRRHGVVVAATVTSRDYYRVRVKHGYQYHYMLYVGGFLDAEGSPEETSVECSYAAYHDESVYVVPLRVVPGQPQIASLGTMPSLQVWRLVATYVLSFLAALLYPLAALGARSWYERRRVRESGAGRLAG